MDKYIATLGIAVFSALMICSTVAVNVSVNAQNTTSTNESMDSNSTGTYNLTSTSLEELDDQVGQISGGGKKR
jgi:hypothetical protein